VENFRFNTIEEAIKDLRAGKMVVVVDDEDRENEGDLVMAAEKATPEAINFMTRHGRGLVCVPLTAERLDQLRIPLMPGASEQSMRTAFAVSVDVVGVSTGISAYERAATVRALADPARGPADFIRPMSDLTCAAEGGMPGLGSSAPNCCRPKRFRK